MLLFVDGFDNYNAVNDMLTYVGNLQYQSIGGFSAGFQTGRNGNGREINASISAVFFQRVAKSGIGISVYLGTGDFVVDLMDTVANQVQMQVVFRQRNYTVEVWQGNGGTLLFRSANNVYGEAQDFVEIWAKADTSAGTVEVHANQQVLANVSGVNTAPSGNLWWDGFQTSQAAMDDLYYADTVAGPGTNPCNTFIGDPRVYTQYPTSNSVAVFSPQPNTNQNWQNVSEISFDGDTSYNHSHNPGDEDLFGVGPVPTTITSILAVQVTGAYRKDDAGLRKMKQALKSSTTEVYGTTRALADTSYQWFADIVAEDPATGVDWTRPGLLAMLIGYNLAA